MRRHARRNHEAETKRLCQIRAEQACKSCQIANSHCKGRNKCQRCLRKGLHCSFSDKRVDRLTHSTMVHRKRSDADTANHPQLPPSASGHNRLVHQHIELYFQHFHPQWPFLHPGTFSVQDEPSLLLQSVVVIGLWAGGTASSRAKALALHDKIGECIHQQKVGSSSHSPS